MDLQELFQLRPLKAAKVSEISEATSASPVPPQDRVNFHIGNPVQDERLIRHYLSLIGRDDSGGEMQPQLELFERAVRASIPYTPRGGYLREKPHPLVLHFKEWITAGQDEPLTYDFGAESGQREVILVSGGRAEYLRVFLHALNRFLIHLPARIMLSGIELPEHLQAFPNLRFTRLPDDESVLAGFLNSYFDDNSAHPVFILLGKRCRESTRRELRDLSLRCPLFFVEFNDTPNHLSMAREARLQHRVLRFLSAAVVCDTARNLALGFAAGEPNFIRVLENVHFELKGTPPAAEMELLTHYCTAGGPEQPPPPAAGDPDPDNGLPIFRSISRLTRENPVYAQLARRNEQLIRSAFDIIEERTKTAAGRIARLHHRAQAAADDTFAFKTNAELFAAFFDRLNDDSWTGQLVLNLQAAFARHHPHYEQDHLTVISGSARTAFSLLGRHCGFSEALITDLSWTYEHCFETVHTVPLTEAYTLDPGRLLAAVDTLIERDSAWPMKGFVVLNNPHNASGAVFREADLRQILAALLSRNIWIIDDLSYENVRPGTDWPELRTLRQIARELHESGYLTRDHLAHLITIHSLSKTDCFAGARLALAEILHPALSEKFKKVMATVQHNYMAIMIAYLFYRNDPGDLRSYWQQRNLVMHERMTALEQARQELPAARNPFHIDVLRPAGSMYPQLVIHDLPPGLSLDWLASGLARNGIGLIPLSAFSRTAEGYEHARKTFRLTLGGPEAAPVLHRKMRRVIIDLNRLIGEESTRYNRNRLTLRHTKTAGPPHFGDTTAFWRDLTGRIETHARKTLPVSLKFLNLRNNAAEDISAFFSGHLPFRLNSLRAHLHDRLHFLTDMLNQVHSGKTGSITDILAREFYKESSAERAANFRHRLFDRTVHPTQMYALAVDLKFDRLIRDYIAGRSIDPARIADLTAALVSEYLGTNVPVRAIDEGEELVHDLKHMILSEEHVRWNSGEALPTFLSFWGDWDGSNRPSGQGHLLVAAVLIENVVQQAQILQSLIRRDRGLAVDRELIDEMNRLPGRISRFWNLLNRINALTNQLEKRYQSIVPADLKSGPWRRAGLRLRVIRDPLKAIWQHNDRLERHMQEMRRQRRMSLEYYFSLNKRLRKTLYTHLGQISKHLGDPAFAIQAGAFRNLLNRFCLTPRIHQNMITSADQFAIDTTVDNLLEINATAARYGNPAMILALQISMSTQPEAFIAIDRKIRSGRDSRLREQADIDLPPLWIIPLFEDTQAVQNIPAYLDAIWNYAIQSRLLDQSPYERMSELLCELFIAGSDLSQQVSQSAASRLYRYSKFEIIRWLSEKGLVDRIRIKFGSGEPMQRQGGYYLREETDSLFRQSANAGQRLDRLLSPAARTSTAYARRPLKGIMGSGEFRTFQSNVFERLKLLPASERAQVIYHVQQAQRFHEHLLNQASEPFIQTRLQPSRRGIQEIERLTVGQNDPLYQEFTELVTRNFRHILYGREEDVVGLHIISYFISRATPILRDRPTVRPTRDISQDQGQKIIRRIAQTLPLARHGSLLRAIGHNQAQTVVLGINQLTTGLFRSFREFAAQQRTYRDGLTLIADRILPQLPVYEILTTLRLYHDTNLAVIERLIRAFPAGNTAFLILREDLDSIKAFTGLLQKEFLRRHGLSVADFFEGDKIIVDLLPSITPDLAVLLQPDLFNADPEQLFGQIAGHIDSEWRKGVRAQLSVPVRIRYWRTMIWRLIEDPLIRQVRSFVELAMALNTLTLERGGADRPYTMEPSKVARMSSNIVNLLRGIRDDSMREFLMSVVQYLSNIPQTMREVPINILRALEDIETIVKIEEQTLSPKDQDILRYYMLKIARLAGENG